MTEEQYSRIKALVSTRQHYQTPPDTWAAAVRMLLAEVDTLNLNMDSR